MEYCTCPHPSIDPDGGTSPSCRECGHWWDVRYGSRPANAVAHHVERLPESVIDLRAIRAAIPARHLRRIHRNDPCPCGSGEKFKRCHGRAIYLGRAA